MFSKVLTLATSDMHSDPSLGNDPYLEIDIVPYIVLFVAPITFLFPSLQ